MRKSDGLTVALSKIKDRYQIISEAYAARTEELNNLLDQVKTVDTINGDNIGHVIDQKIYACNEILNQFQSWLDDVQSLEIVDVLEQKVTDLYAQSKEEAALIDNIKFIVKNLLKARNNKPLFTELSRELDNKLSLLRKSIEQTKQMSSALNDSLFGKHKLINSLAEHM
ncbi:MAG: hypothetical protein ACTSQY_08990 [Candidatus Odinarchaeia archaeon]